MIRAGPGLHLPVPSALVAYCASQGSRSDYTVVEFLDTTGAVQSVTRIAEASDLWQFVPLAART